MIASSKFCGIGLKHLHYKEFIDILPPLSLVEVHTENFFSNNYRLHEILRALSENYDLSFHCVGMSLGSADSLNIDYLKRLKELAGIYKPKFISDHLSWSSTDNNYFHDLLPFPYNAESFKIFSEKINFVQDYLSAQILIENPSLYVSFAESTNSETEFLNELVSNTDCGLLLDINNIFVSSHNLSFNAYEYLDTIDARAIKQIHLAGFEEGSSGLLIDTHSRVVSSEVLELFKYFITKHGARPTIFEQDQNLGALSALLNEAEKINLIIDASRS
jgi:uncharacterized protein (UPF0276 family)